LRLHELSFTRLPAHSQDVPTSPYRFGDSTPIHQADETIGRIHRRRCVDCEYCAGTVFERATPASGIEYSASASINIAFTSGQVLAT